MCVGGVLVFLYLWGPMKPIHDLGSNSFVRTKMLDPVIPTNIFGVKRC